MKRETKTQRMRREQKGKGMKGEGKEREVRKKRTLLETEREKK